ncbi:MAG TPA: hypothetical protein VK469_13315 [Candidatus Kapabacteria bacterium]|nr:hypothetical protein [Candidatus Kapabacteria bacterium]
MINKSRKEFNGLCVLHLYYVADRSTKIVYLMEELKWDRPISLFIEGNGGKYGI